MPETDVLSDVKKALESIRLPWPEMMSDCSEVLSDYLTDVAPADTDALYTVMNAAPALVATIAEQAKRIEELDRRGRELCQWIGVTLAELRVSTPEDAAKELARRREETIANRATIQRLNRRAQKAEGALAKALKEPKGVDTWKSAERQKEAAERDRMMETIGKVGR